MPDRFLPSLLLVVLLAGCARTPTLPESAPPPVATAPAPSPAQATPPVAEAAPPSPPPSVLPAMPWLKTARFEDLPGWQGDDPAQAWPALQASCSALRRQPAWARTCQAVEQLQARDGLGIRQFIEANFTPYQILQADGGAEGLVTGYYEPLLRGSRTLTPRYRFPVYAPPDDLLMIDLGSLYPELKNLRLRGRLEGRKVVPYFSRAEIENGRAALRGKELAWVDDPVELFFLQIQGSGRIQLDSGEMIRVGYADQNGHPYKSIGKWLVDQGELTLDQASMQGIKEWGRTHPERLAEVLNANPSFVFFRLLNHATGGPLGALGVPLTPERSIAVDPRGTPLGAPVWLATTWPNSGRPLERLMLAQDTGGAIRGNVRADFFWGFGEAAGAQAGAMKQKGRMWVLLPRDYPTNGPTNGVGGAP